MGYICTKTIFDELIKKFSKAAGNDPCLIKAIIKNESGFNPSIVNKTAREFSVGLGQINILAFPQYTEEALKDPATNIKAMNLIVTALKKKYTNLFDIISAYNAGHPIVDSKTNIYVNNVYVMNVYRNYLLYSATSLGGLL